MPLICTWYMSDIFFVCMMGSGMMSISGSGGGRILRSGLARYPFEVVPFSLGTLLA